jgi:hypothetical protein
VGAGELRARGRRAGSDRAESLRALHLAFGPIVVKAGPVFEEPRKRAGSEYKRMRRRDAFIRTVLQLTETSSSLSRIDNYATFGVDAAGETDTTSRKPDNGCYVK